MLLLRLNAEVRSEIRRECMAIRADVITAHRSRCKEVVRMCRTWTRGESELVADARRVARR